MGIHHRSGSDQVRWRRLRGSAHVQGRHTQEANEGKDARPQKQTSNSLNARAKGVMYRQSPQMASFTLAQVFFLPDRVKVYNTNGQKSLNANLFLSLCVPMVDFRGFVLYLGVRIQQTHSQICHRGALPQCPVCTAEYSNSSITEASIASCCWR